MPSKIRFYRLIYSIVLYAVAPLVPLYLLYRARRQPEYARGWSERFAFYRKPRVVSAARRVWLHAVSLGETRATKPLVDAFFAKHPKAHIILTHTTPTGRAAGQELFAAYLQSRQMTQVYVPYDLPDVIARFLRYFAPTDCWLMETEIWPNSIAACVKLGVPVSLLNGRLSDKTLQKTLKNSFVAQLFGVAYAQLSHVCAQTAIDAARYLSVGVIADALTVTGNLKFDMALPFAQIESGKRLKASLEPSRRVVLLASTREGEERLWLDALAHFDDVDIQWWLVPRHPQRFDDVEALLYNAGFDREAVLRKTKWAGLAEARRAECLRSAKIVLGDTMGEMFAYYAIADVVIMGGAWQPLGGQNFLEPLALGKPVIVGQHSHNFAQATQDAVAVGALMQMTDIRAALAQVRNILNDQQAAQKYRANALAFVAQHQGAVQKTLSVILP